MGQQSSVGHIVFMVFNICITTVLHLSIIHAKQQYFSLMMIEIDYCGLGWESNTHL